MAVTLQITYFIRHLVCGLVRASKASYYTDLIAELESKPRELFGILKALLKGRAEKLYPPCNSSVDVANKFADYLSRKLAQEEKILISGE